MKSMSAITNCRICGKQFWRNNSTHVVCSYECALELNKKNKDKQQKEADKEWRRRRKVGLNKLKTHGDFQKSLQTEINAIVRLIDSGCVCISCQTPPKKFNAGHYFSVGSNNSLRFNLFNNHGQCEHCNTYLSGNLISYRENLELIYGKDYLYKVTTLKLTYPEIKLTKEELNEAIIKARKIKNRLIKQVELLNADNGPVFPTKVRIRMRDEINKELGIYQ